MFSDIHLPLDYIVNRILLCRIYVKLRDIKMNKQFINISIRKEKTQIYRKRCNKFIKSLFNLKSVEFYIVLLLIVNNLFPKEERSLNI